MGLPRYRAAGSCHGPASEASLLGFPDFFFFLKGVVLSQAILIRTVASGGSKGCALIIGIARTGFTCAFEAFSGPGALVGVIIKTENYFERGLAQGHPENRSVSKSLHSKST
jgi:hypothetical protein